MRQHLVDPAAATDERERGGHGGGRAGSIRRIASTRRLLARRRSDRLDGSSSFSCCSAGAARQQCVYGSGSAGSASMPTPWAPGWARFLTACERLFIIYSSACMSRRQEMVNVCRNTTHKIQAEKCHTSVSVSARRRARLQRGATPRTCAGRETPAHSFGPMRHARVFNTPVYYFSTSPNT